MRPLLALLLFLPAFTILAALYLRRPDHARWSRRVDAAVLTLGAAITTVCTLQAYTAAQAQQAGNLWPDVAAALAAFHSFPLLLALAWWLRRPKAGSQLSPMRQPDTSERVR